MGAADAALRALGVSIRYCERRKERSAVERALPQDIHHR